MHNAQALHWLPYPTDSSLDIKVEPQTETPLLSPPSSPSFTNTTLSTPHCRRRSGSPKRQRPYPPLITRFDNRARTSADPKMSSSYNSQWPARGGSVGSGRSSNERSSDDEQQMAYSTTNYSGSSAIDRPTSSSSSLSGAIGDPRILPSTSRFSGPSPGGMNEALAWPAGHPQPQMLPSQSTMYTGLPPHIPFYDSAEADVSAMAYHDYRNDSSPPSSFTSPSFADPYKQYETFPTHPPSSSSGSPYSTSPQEEIRNLRRRIKELERASEQDKERIRMLHIELNSNSSPRLSTSPSFQESWRLRTEARQRQFCSLNRAGNALCAWHDSRRERRVHPPRMAPPGYLNCGCSFEEALFEESLSRHGVGSYLPGESVRMDPALRNPLLKLLQERYGYRDGDFERDPRTGDWVAGDGPAKWEQQLHAGVTNPRRPRADHDRR
ncbi:hypothetical protein DFS33DRAFT_1384300 [Desarmillaria ectypa]|nr:hypothetical protein DFS33DRAFT_1384300 [Desarmillaria ectypa]